MGNRAARRGGNAGGAGRGNVRQLGNRAARRGGHGGGDGRIQVSGRRQLEESKEVMINPNFDPDNSFYDRASDENFEMEEAPDEEEESEESYSDDESQDYKAKKNSGGAMSRYERQNYH